MVRKRRTFTILALALAGCGGGGAVAIDDPDASAVAAPDATPAPDAQPHACAPDRAAGHQTFACPDGVGADVEVPEACVDGGCGVILDVHGYTMSADIEDQHTRMRALATARGYVVVQPTAPGVPASWGLGEHDEIVWDLLLATIDVFHVDPDRVHVTGFSQGGMMSFRLLCSHADRIASIAPVAGDGCFDGSGEPAIERPILYIHGHLDAIIPWATMGAPQRDAMLAAWDYGAPTTIDSGPSFTASRWTTSAGTPFELYEHDFTTGDALLVGHCLPGPDDNLTFRCDGSGFDEATLVLDFFDAHPRS
jgi:polyhydroxybutyrate depolymerase